MPQQRFEKNAQITGPGRVRRAWSGWQMQYLAGFMAVTALAAGLYFVGGKGMLVLPNASDPPGMGDCLYFSVVTVSSLGYGDIRPVGLGRVVAGTEVAGGLVLLGLWVSALASRRAELLLVGLHGHAVDARFKQFRGSIAKLSREFRELSTTKVSPPRLWSTGVDPGATVMDELHAAVSGMVRHIRREVTQGGFFEMTPDRFIGRLLGACTESVTCLAEAARQGVLDKTNKEAAGNVKRLGQVLHDYSVVADCMQRESPYASHRVDGAKLAEAVDRLRSERG